MPAPIRHLACRDLDEAAEKIKKVGDAISYITANAKQG